MTPTSPSGRKSKQLEHSEDARVSTLHKYREVLASNSSQCSTTLAVSGSILGKGSAG